MLTTQTLAPYQPWGDEAYSLVNNFDFRVFMFNDMQSGDSVIIKAQVLYPLHCTLYTVYCTLYTVQSTL